MEKKATLNLRVDPEVKKKAENVLNQLGIPMSTAINIYLNQIYLKGGIPFDIKLPVAPPELDASAMTDEELWAEIEKGVKDEEAGRMQDAASAFAKFREEHGFAEHRDEAV